MSRLIQTNSDLCPSRNGRCTEMHQCLDKPTGATGDVFLFPSPVTVSI